MSLPEPTRTRWQPLRAGLVDLFYYDAEEFLFRDGRLLLRGNNGTGKSKVLALTLPFLLDGDLAAHRVEPDADPKKKMEWNLLLGGDHPSSERLGYSWLEFGRQDADGTTHFRTIGCGFKAVSGRGIARHWFFLTDQRVGSDLSLVDSTRTALTRDRLVDAIGDRGSVYDRARDYRRAIDEALFSLGEQRYGALVDLLIHLRQPQLSKRPSEKALSAALTEALPPLDQAVIADVAEAFRSLEEDREALTAMTEGRDAAMSFLTHYRRYAQIGARRKARLPREAQSAFEKARDELATAERAYTEAENALTAARERLDESREQQNRLETRDRTLRASPDMRSARELDLARTDSNRLTRTAGELADQRDKASEWAATTRRRHEEAIERLDGDAEELTAVRQAAVDAASASRLETEHSRLVDLPLLGQPDLSDVRRDADSLVARQRRAIDQVTRLLSAADEAAKALAAARARIFELDSEAAELAQRRTDADAAVTFAGGELVSSVRDHLTDATELRIADLAKTIAELELWVETLSGPNPALSAVHSANQRASDDLARADADYDRMERDSRQQVEELNAERARLERGEDAVPPPHYARPATREGRDGAPLWRLIDFAENVSDEDRAGVEAALEAAGILDAWVTPGGELLAAGTEDIMLRGGDPAETNLNSLLIPAVDRADPAANTVADSTIIGLMSAIGWGEDGQNWVTSDGRFRLGVLEGSWHKPAARYIGSGAREAARRARLAELLTTLSETNHFLTEVAAERETLRTRKRTLADETAGLPPDAGVRQAHANVRSLDDERTRLVGRQDAAAEKANDAETALATARDQLAEGAEDTNLPAESSALAEVANALNDYRFALAKLWPAVRAFRSIQRQVSQAAGDLEQATSAAEGLADRATSAKQEAISAREHFTTLKGTVGAVVAELERQLEQVASDLRTNKSEQSAVNKEIEKWIGARGEANGKRTELVGRVAEVTRAREDAAEGFRRFTRTGLLAVALPALEIPDPEKSWAPVPAMRLARRGASTMSSSESTTTTTRRNALINGSTPN